MNIQRDSNNNQFWPCQLCNDGVPTRLVPAYIGDGYKMHAVDELALADGRGTALCGKAGRLKRGVVTDSDWWLVCVTCACFMGKLGGSNEICTNPGRSKAPPGL